MTAQLNELLARQRTADFTRSAEWARLARQSRSTGSASSRAGWIARFLAAHRPGQALHAGVSAEGPQQEALR